MKRKPNLWSKAKFRKRKAYAKISYAAIQTSGKPTNKRFNNNVNRLNHREMSKSPSTMNATNYDEEKDYGRDGNGLRKILGATAVRLKSKSLEALKLKYNAAQKILHTTNELKKSKA